MPESLTAALDGLYGVFARYSLAPHVRGCPDCVSENDDALLHSAPLRELGPRELGRYALKAMTTWGTADDFRHFLPRIFELVSADGGGDWIDPEVVLGKLAYGEWRRWPTDEQRAVERFLDAMWLNVLGRFPHPLESDSTLCGIGQAIDNLAPYLERWDIAGSRPAAYHFATFVDWNASAIRHKPGRAWRLANAWWKRRPAQAERVAAWLLADARVEELERAFFSFGSDEAAAGPLSDGVNYLGAIRAAATGPISE